MDTTNMPNMNMAFRIKVAQSEKVIRMIIGFLMRCISLFIDNSDKHLRTLWLYYIVVST